MIKCWRRWWSSRTSDVDTLRQIRLLLDRENQRLIAKNLQLTSELARLRGVTHPEHLELVLRQQLEQTRAQVFAREVPSRRRRGPPARAPGPRAARAAGLAESGNSSRAHPRSARLPRVWRRGDGDGRRQYETSERVTTEQLTYHLEHHLRQKYRCACNGAVVTAPGPVQLTPGRQYAPEFAVGVAVVYGRRDFADRTG
jgi:transposase